MKYPNLEHPTMPPTKTPKLSDRTSSSDRIGPPEELSRPMLTDIPASLTVDELREGLRRRYDGLRALEVEYTQDTQSFDYEYERIPHGQHHFAFSGGKRLKAQSNAALHEQFFYPDVVWAWDGRVQQTYNPRNQAAYFKSEFERFADSDIYLGNTGIPIGGDDANAAMNSPARGRPWTMRLEDAALGWRVLPMLEMVDGAACHVLLSKNTEKIWIDPEIGFGIRFKEGYRRPKLPRDEWTLSGRVAYRDFRLVGGRNWFPWRLEYVSYVADPAFDLIFGQVAFSIVTQVQRLAINADVPDSLFALQFPPGTVIRDKVHKRFYRIGDSGDEIKMGDWE